MDAVIVSAFVVGVAIAIAVLMYHFFSKRREHFTSSTASISLFDLSEFAALPSEIKDMIRAATAKMSGALTVKLNEMYKTNPEYVQTAIDKLSTLGISTIMTFGVPQVTAPAPAAPAASAAPAPAPAPPARAPAADPADSSASNLPFGKSFMPIEAASASPSSAGPFIESFV